MKIRGAKTIAEYKAMQEEHIVRWIKENFIDDAVKWKFEGASSIKVTDKTGDSMIVSLNDID